MPEINLKLPYIATISKNKMKGFVNGHYYTQPSYKDAVENLANLIKLKKLKWKKEKVWIEIFFQKPQMRCDVSNLIDGMCDAIKKGIDVDDCFFSLKADWEFDKRLKPYIILKIIQ